MPCKKGYTPVYTEYIERDKPLGEIPIGKDGNTSIFRITNASRHHLLKAEINAVGPPELEYKESELIGLDSDGEAISALYTFRFIPKTSSLPSDIASDVKKVLITEIRKRG